MAERMTPSWRFPGMDPWLEAPSVWPSVHHWLIGDLAHDLTRQLAPRYVAWPGEREVLEVFERAIVPDVAVVRPRRRPPAGSGGVATLDVERPVIINVQEEEVREGFIEIRDVSGGGKVVTVIEVLSPTNKRAGSKTRDKYLQKQSEVLSSRANLVEIDLLRGGAHTVAIEETSRAELPLHHYLVVVRRATRRSRAEAYPVKLSRRLPRIPIPLLPRDPDAVVDLQEHLERVYETGAFALRIDYGRPPEPPLRGRDLTWARRALRSLRSLRSRRPS